MDPLLDIPLYRQIAARIRHQIATADLVDGDPLPSLRDGATRWGVNLHTVRRAYEELEAEGLVATVPRQGTRVTAPADLALASDAGDLNAFVDWVARSAAERFGLSPTEMANRLRDAARPAGPVWVLECSTSLASSLADQIGRWSGVEARPWLVHRVRETPPGHILATYFHHAEVRDALAGESRQAAFFRVRLEEDNLRRLSAAARAAGALVLLAVDRATGGALADELRAALGSDASVELRITRRPSAELARVPGPVPVVLTPENWDRLDEATRAGRRLFEVVLRPELEDLARIAAAQGWAVGAPASHR